MAQPTFPLLHLSLPALGQVTYPLPPLILSVAPLSVFAPDRRLMRHNVSPRSHWPHRCMRFSENLLLDSTPVPSRLANGAARCPLLPQGRASGHRLSTHANGNARAGRASRRPPAAPWAAMTAPATGVSPRGGRSGSRVGAWATLSGQCYRPSGHRHWEDRVATVKTHAGWLATSLSNGISSRRGEKAPRSPRSFTPAWLCRARSTAQYDGSGGQTVRLPYALAMILERLIGDACLRRALVSTRQSARGAREVHEKRTAFVRLIRSDEGEASLTRAKGEISLRGCTLRLVRFVTERGRRPICAPLGCARREAIGGLARWPCGRGTTSQWRTSLP